MFFKTAKLLLFFVTTTYTYKLLLFFNISAIFRLKYHARLYHLYRVPRPFRHLAYTWHTYIVLHLSHWLHSHNNPCTILHAVGHSPLHIYGCQWLLTNRSDSGLVRHEAMPSALLRLSKFSFLQLNRTNRLRHCRRNRMSLCVYFVYSVICASLCKEDVCHLFPNLFTQITLRYN